jgi:hypothetical protein
MVFVVETEEIKENQDALEDLLRYCKTPEKWITAILLAYSVRVSTSKEQREIFDRVFQKRK